MKMKIIQVTDEAIVFGNGNKITYDHVQDCCESNFADFKSLEDTLAMETEFDDNLVFEVVKGYGDDNKGSGFRFCNQIICSLFLVIHIRMDITLPIYRFIILKRYWI